MDETAPLLARPAVAQHKHRLLWLLCPVAILTSLSHGIQTGSRTAIYSSFLCPKTNSHLPDECTRYRFIGHNQIFFPVALIAIETVVVTVTTGGWTRFADLRGRKSVLMLTTLGSLLCHAAFAFFTRHLHFAIWFGTMVNAFLGSFITFTAVSHAYVADCTTAAARLPVFAVLQGTLLICWISGEMIADALFPVAGSSVTALLGVALCMLNMTYIGFFLPESVEDITPRDHPRWKEAVRAMAFPITLFVPRSSFPFLHIAMFALSFYVYSCSMASDSFGISLLLRYDPDVGFFFNAGVIFFKAASYFLIPAIIWVVKRFWTTDSLESVINLEKAWIMNLTLVCGLLFSLILASPTILALILVIAVPMFSASVLPAYYALGSAYFEEMDRTSNMGSLFGAMSVIQLLAETMTRLFFLLILGPSTNDNGFITLFTCACLVLSSILLRAQ